MVENRIVRMSLHSSMNMKLRQNKELLPYIFRLTYEKSTMEDGTLCVTKEWILSNQRKIMYSVAELLSIAKQYENMYSDGKRVLKEQRKKETKKQKLSMSTLRLVNPASLCIRKFF